MIQRALRRNQPVSRWPSSVRQIRNSILGRSKEVQGNPRKHRSGVSTNCRPSAGWVPERLGGRQGMTKGTVSSEAFQMLRSVDSPTLSKAIEPYNVRDRLTGYAGY